MPKHQGVSVNNFLYIVFGFDFSSGVKSWAWGKLRGINVRSARPGLEECETLWDRPG